MQAQYQVLLEELINRERDARGNEDHPAAVVALNTEQEFARAYLRSTAYPDLVAAVVEAEVVIDGAREPWPPTFERFVAWPEQWAMGLHDKWADAVYELNPHWRNVPGETEKKASPTISTPASRATSKRRRTTATGSSRT